MRSGKDIHRAGQARTSFLLAGLCRGGKFAFFSGTRWRARASKDRPLFNSLRELGPETQGAPTRKGQARTQFTP